METIPHRHHLEDNKSAIIYISEVGEGLWTAELALALQKVFKIETISNASDIGMILNESLRGSPVSDLLDSILDVQELPKSWLVRLEQGYTERDETRMPSGNSSHSIVLPVLSSFLTVFRIQ